jgi:hypothetical protein
MVNGAVVRHSPFISELKPENRLRVRLSESAGRHEDLKLLFPLRVGDCRFG